MSLPAQSAARAEVSADAAAREAAACHREVLVALQALGDAQRGKAVQLDRGSALPHLGIAVPVLRARVKQGFSFSRRPWAEQLRIWNALWCSSPWADVLFAALEALAPVVRKPMTPAVAQGLWDTVQTWHGRVDNWCHADMLSTVISRLLEARFDDVYPVLLAWNAREGEPLWPRRLSLTSLVHYTGKNAVFLPSRVMHPLLVRCVPDRRKPIEQALGWVLRELDRARPQDAEAFLQGHAGAMGRIALARALEKRGAEERRRWLAAR